MSSVPTSATEDFDLKLDPPKPGDERLLPADLAGISCFAGLNPGRLSRLDPEQFVLRRCQPGRVICEQGAAGSSAFYVLTKQDVRELRKSQLAQQRTELETLEKVLAASPEERPAISPEYGEVEQTELILLIQSVKKRIATLSTVVDEADKQQLEPISPVLSVYLELPDVEEKRQKKNLVARLKDFIFNPVNKGSREEEVSLIPIDAPAVLSSESPSARLKEGDLFGEMSCLYRTPRSATVIVDQPCYILEMLRNILDFIRKDDAHRERMDGEYRERVLEAHLQQLSIFRGIEGNKQALERLRQVVELKQFLAGDVIFEEHDDSDAMYIVRSGLVKVVKNVNCQFRKDDFIESQWKTLANELGELKHGGDLVSDKVNFELERVFPDWKAWSATALQPESRESLLRGLNEFVKEADIQKQLGESTEEVVQKVGRHQVALALKFYPDDPEHWSALERRIFNRLILEACCPLGLPSRSLVSGPMQTLSYCGQGEVLGEMGVVLDMPRSATCVAYDHPDGRSGMRLPDAKKGLPSVLELVRIDRKAFDELRKEIPGFEDRLREIIKARQSRSFQRREDRTPAAGGVAKTDLEPLSLVQEQMRQVQEQLGLVQGQKLMLIDLDRCTRCGACVEACVSAHKDGNTRLYLDGPRYENYLIPVSCRKCLDPVCLIGCPVGAINRGDNGEILIKNWCIGCNLCAEQCPYGSIQMTTFASESSVGEANKPSAADAKAVKQAVVCDLCSSSTLGKEACVYSCPHDAATRVLASSYFSLK